MTTPTPTDVARLRELLEKATPGPWAIDDGMRDWIADVLDVPYEDAPDAVWLTGPAWIEVDDKNYFPGPDAALIVAAVNALPDLLDRLERAEARVVELETATVRRLTADD